MAHRGKVLPTKAQFKILQLLNEPETFIQRRGYFGFELIQPGRLETIRLGEPTLDILESNNWVERVLVLPNKWYITREGQVMVEAGKTY